MVILLELYSIGFFLKQFTLIIASSLLLLSGCSTLSERYVPSSEKEKASTNYKTVRLLNDANRSETVISTIYLNDVYAKYTEGKWSHFVVAFYNPQHKNRLFFKQEDNRSTGEFTLLLNGEDANSSQTLDHDDLLVELLPVHNAWNTYYYVRYKLPSEKPVLELESDHKQQAVIAY